MGIVKIWYINLNFKFDYAATYSTSTLRIGYIFNMKYGCSLATPTLGPTPKLGSTRKMRARGMRKTRERLPSDESEQRLKVVAPKNTKSAHFYIKSVKTLLGKLKKIQVGWVF